MREKLHAAHPNRVGLFDLKHDRGGMIDIEFCVQFLVLAHAHEHADLTGNLGNIALLHMAAELGLIPRELAERCRDAYREFRRLQHSLRLNGAQLRARTADRGCDAPRSGAGALAGGAQPVLKSLMSGESVSICPRLSFSRARGKRLVAPR